jgi:hypothetical protein
MENDLENANPRYRFTRLARGSENLESERTLRFLAVRV